MDSNAKRQIECDSTLYTFDLKRLPGVSQLLHSTVAGTHNNLIVIKIVNQLFAAITDVVAKTFPIEFDRKSTLGTISHGSDFIRFLWLNIVLREGLLCLIPCDDELCSLASYPLTLN